MGPDGLHSRHWLRRGRHRPIGKRCLRPHLPSSSVCCVLADISARVYTSRGGKDRLKNRASPASRRSGVTLTRVLLRRDAYNNATSRTSAIRDSPRRDTDDHEMTRTPVRDTTCLHQRFTCRENGYAPSIYAYDLSPENFRQFDVSVWSSRLFFVSACD